MKKNLIYVGPSDTLDIIKNSDLNNYTVLGYTGLDKRSSTSKFISNKNLAKFKGNYLINNILNNIDRKNFFLNYKSKFKFIGLKHKTAQIFETANIDKSLIAYPNVIISSFSKIGMGNIISYGSLVGHNVIIGKFNYICPSCNILGNVKIGNYCFIGSNVTILPNIEIPSYSAIPAGSVITRNPEKNSIFKIYSKKY